MSKGYITRFRAYFVLIVIQITLFGILLPHWQTTDEPTWVGNGIKFEQAVLQHNWKNTRLTTRPGVTVEWVVALTSHYTFGSTVLRTTLPDELSAQQVITTNSRIAILACLIIFNLLLYKLLCTLLSYRSAFLIALLISIHPIFTSRVYLVWTDMFLVYFLALTVLSFFVFIQHNHKSFLFLTGLFFGLAILTKVIAWVAIPMLVIAVLFTPNKKHQLLNAVGLSILISLAVFYMLYPAAWIYRGILFDRTHEVEITYTSPHAVISQQPIWQYPLFAFLIDPPLFILSLLVIYIIARQTSQVPYSFSIPFFAMAAFYLVSVYATSFLKDEGLFSIRSDRYIAPLIPFLLIGVMFFIEKFKTRFALSEVLATGLAIFYITTALSMLV